MIANYFVKYLKPTHLAIQVLGTKASSIHEVKEEGSLVMLLHPNHLKSPKFHICFKYFLIMTFWVMFSLVEPTRPTARKT